MAFSNAQAARLLLNYGHLSGVTRGYKADSITDMLKVTSLLDTADQFVPGLVHGAVSIDMMLDNTSTTGSQWDVFTQLETTNPAVLTFAPFGLTAGLITFMANMIETQFTESVQPNDVSLVSCTGEPDGLVDYGVVVEPLNTISANTTGTAVDNGALTSNGGVAHLHVTAYSGFTSDTILIEHSTDNSTFATLGTFTTVTALTSQRLTISSGTTVNRYVRIKDTVVGAGSITRTLAFSRR